MTAREIGSGLSRMSRRGRRTVAGRPVASYRKKEKMSQSEKRRLGQLVVCAFIFVSIVAARLLLPEKMGQLSASLREVMGRSMDVQEVFSAVGRAVSGQESVSDTLGDVYQAVFQPGEDAGAVETAATAPLDWPRLEPMSRLRAVADGAEGSWPGTPEERAVDAEEETPPAAGAAPQTQQVNTAPTGQLNAVSLVYTNLPKNVCMEQQILGFSYASPVVGVLSSGFGYREHPIEGEEKFHYGVDLAVDEGTAIGSFADGTVSAVGESSSLGKYVIVSHENGYSTLYAHCSKVTVSSGATVSRGQKLAEAGQTGLATGPHCHFELHRDSNYLNPIYYVQLA